MKYVEKSILYIILTAIAVVFVYPFIWMIYTALKSDTEVLDNPLKLPEAKYYVIEKGWKAQYQKALHRYLSKP